MFARRTLALVATLSLFVSAAPVLAGDDGHGDDMDKTDHVIGALTITSPFARATLPNQPVAGAFLTIVNSGSEDDVLVSVSVDFAARGEIHEMAMEGDTMKMRPLTDGLIIPAGKTIELKPGGYHLMFMKLQKPLVEGDTFEVTLEFQNAGTVSVPFSVLVKGAKSMDHAGHGS